MPEQTTDRWEYFTQEMFGDNALNIAKLNRLGRDGWEIIHVGRLSYLLKRRMESGDGEILSRNLLTEEDAGLIASAWMQAFLNSAPKDTKQ